METEYKRIIVKIGSRVLSGGGDEIDADFLAEFVAGLAALHQRGIEIALVSSGAIRTGAPRLNLMQDRLSISQQQAAAAVGQGLLIAQYNELFSRHGIVTAQVLLTPDIMNMRRKYLNARNTLRTLLAYRTVPIINENDTVAYEEIKFGDNDTLGATAAIIVDADLLILLSDVEGLYSGAPGSDGAELYAEVNEITPEIIGIAGGPERGGGFGGMATKIEAAKAAMESGIAMIIANGRTPDVLSRIVDGEKIGTRFTPHSTRLNSRKRWLAYSCKPEGRIIVNAGARDAIVDKGKSLLPSGIVAVERSFEHGACVEICTEDKKIIAHGLTNYSSLEVKHIMGRHSREIESILSFKISDDVVHRDDLALV